MQCSLTPTPVSIQDTCEIPRTDFSSKICSKPLGRGEGARIYILTGLEGKQGLSQLTVTQWAVRILRVISSHLQIQWGECVCSVDVIPCEKACVMVPSLWAALLMVSPHFRSPSSPWMVFLMRSRRVVCHWSRREIESNSLTWVTQTERNDQRWLTLLQRSHNSYI